MERNKAGISYEQWSFRVNKELDELFCTTPISSSERRLARQLWLECEHPDSSAITIFGRRPGVKEAAWRHLEERK